MSDLAIFLAGSFTSLLCVLFVVLTVREVRRTERRERLAVGELAVLDDLLGIDEPALVVLRPLLQPVERPRRDAAPYGDRHVDGHAAPARLVEEHDHLGVAGLHPVR